MTKRRTVNLSVQTYELLNTVTNGLEVIFQKQISYDQVIRALLTLKVNMADMEF